jgi:hypothetical protein
MAAGEAPLMGPVWICMTPHTQTFRPCLLARIEVIGHLEPFVFDGLGAIAGTRHRYDDRAFRKTVGAAFAEHTGQGLRRDVARHHETATIAISLVDECGELQRFPLRSRRRANFVEKPCTAL